jgi:hypothetical protein
MCTVTIVATRRTPLARPPAIAPLGVEPVVRLVCNRDESRRRPAALPPERRTCGRRTAVMPVDPVSEGTWIGVNNAGLAATLLNVYDSRDGDTTKPAAGEFHSRGEIIPRLLEYAALDEASDAVAGIQAGRFPPFRLVLLDAQHVRETVSDGATIQLRSLRGFDRPILFTSSGLGDHLVEPPRRELFDSLFETSDDWIRDQDLFHTHVWPDRPHLSVQMSRAEARTVSRTWVEISADRIELTYLSMNDDHPADPVSMQIARSRRGHD